MQRLHLLTVPLLGVLLFAAAAARAQSSAPEPYRAAPTAEHPIQGIWVWQSKWITDAGERQALLDLCERYGYDRLLMQVHLDQLEPSGLKPALRYPEAMRALLIEAAARGIAVEALDGDKAMAMRKNWPRTLAVLDLILSFNRSLPDDAKLAGVHYDIEPYIMDQWKAGGEQRQQVMLDLLSFYDQARTRLQDDGSGLTLSADIPFWYDNKTEPDDNCIVTYNGQTKNLHQHIQDICDYIGIMSYRRSATGSNSVTAVVENELRYAARIGKTVTPALETIELKDVPQITFYGATPEEFWQVQEKVQQTLGGHPGYGGMLTHCYRGVRDLFDAGDVTPAR